MIRPIRILLLEDTETDAILIARELDRLGLKYILKHVEDEVGFRRALKEYVPDLILSDYNLPHFNAMEALRIALVQTPHAPFIVVTGSINEEIAVDCIKAGAIDYVLKDHLPRLVIAVKEALELKKVREEKESAAIALLKSERQYRELFNDALDMIHIIDSEGKIVDVNKIELEKLGYEKEELLGKSLLDIISPDYKNKTQESLREAFKGKVIEAYETILLSKQGENYHVEVNAVPQVEGEKTVGIRAIIRDITERKKTELELEKYRNHLEELVSKRTEELEQSEKRFRAIASTAHDAIIMMDNQGFISFWNLAAKKMFGYSKKEAQGKELHLLLVPKKYQSAWQQGMKAFQREGKVPVLGKTLELVAMRKSGQEFPIELSVSGLEMGGETHAVCIMRDITSRKKAEDILRFQAEIVQNMVEGVYLIRSRDGIVVYTNPRFEQMFGYGPNELIGKHVSKINAHGDKSPEATAEEIIKALTETGRWGGEILNLKKDGTTFWCYAQVSTFHHSKYGDVWIAIHEDISIRIKLQEELARKNKLALLGELAGGIAHELRNPLGTIKNTAYFLNMSLEKPDKDVKEILGVLEEEIKVASETITSLLDFARPDVPSRGNVNVNRVVQNALSRIDVPENIEVVTQLDKTVSAVLADPDQLERAFENIILNAVQAMPEGGRLTAKTGSTDSKQTWVSFEDTGIGIGRNDLEMLFEPLFTTKAKGIGLGLALTKLFIERNEGRIEVQSEEGKGSTFTIELPAAVKTNREKHD